MHNDYTMEIVNKEVYHGEYIIREKCAKCARFYGEEVHAFAECFRNPKPMGSNDYYQLNVYISVGAYGDRDFIWGEFFGKEAMPQKEIEQHMAACVHNSIIEPQYDDESPNDIEDYLVKQALYEDWSAEVDECSNRAEAVEELLGAANPSDMKSYVEQEEGEEAEPDEDVPESSEYQQELSELPRVDMCSTMINNIDYYSFLLPAAAFDFPTDTLIELSVELLKSIDGAFFLANVWARQKESTIKVFAYSFVIPVSDNPGVAVVESLNKSREFCGAMRAIIPELSKFGV